MLLLGILGFAAGAGTWIWQRWPDHPLPMAPELRLHPAQSLALPVKNDLLQTDAPPQDTPDLLPDSPDRVADARLRHGSAIAAGFAAAGLRYPPGEVFIRVFKYEGQLELWARDNPAEAEPFHLVHTFPILRASGRLGPKRQEGDCQVPEGFYSSDRFNPRSLFHLSLGLDYPNASDRILTIDREHPGSDVFIHGGCESIGCLALGDPVIEEVFLAAWDAKQHGQSHFAVHIFPCRMDEMGEAAILAPAYRQDPKLQTFWQNLQQGYDAFEQTRQLSFIQVRDDGSYAITCPDGR